MKKIKKILSALIALALLISVFMLTACDSNYVLVDLETGYEQGLIDYDDLSNIAYYGGPISLNQDKFANNFTPNQKGELSEDIKKSIKKSLVDYCNKKYKRLFTTNNVKLGEFYGEYNGYLVFAFYISSYFNINNGNDSTLVIPLYNVGGFYFNKKGHKELGIYLWKKL